MALPEPSNAKTLHKLLLLLETLDPIQGPRAACFLSCNNKLADKTIVRRRFVEAIAYVCAFDKGPRYVIAAALQAGGTGITVWLAGNQSIESKVIDFLVSLLKELTEFARRPDGHAGVEEVESAKLLPDLIAFQTLKIQRYYQSVMNGCLSRCFKIIDSAIARGSSERLETSDLSALREWLAARFPEASSFPEGKQLEVLVRDCYNIRYTNHAKTFGLLNKQEQQGYQEFQLLYKHLGKIGRQIPVAQALVNAAKELPDFLKEFRVRCVPSPSEKKLPISKNDTLKRILKKNLSKQDRKRYLERLRQLRGGNDIPSVPTPKNDIKAHVQAEILLLNFFFKNGYKMVSGDRFIGCSKPACYLCHAYFENHPGGFVVPPTHNKIYQKWRMPDTEDSEMSENMLAKLIEKIEKDLYTEISNSTSKRPYHPDSPM